MELRLGKIHARQRLGMESDHHHRVFSHSGKFFHLENWYSVHAFIRISLQLVGLHKKGQRNASEIAIRHNEFILPHLPEEFDGFRILHLSDLHVDMHPPAVHALIERLHEVDYDICVITGDFRARTFGGFEKTMEIISSVRTHLKDTVYAVLGNHDSIRMVPGLEEMGISLLLNENIVINRGEASLFLAGVDDAHFYHLDNIEKAMTNIPEQGVKILLSHTPEIYRQASHADFDVFLCGHTHGGQICLPGGIPVVLEARCPRKLGKGLWKYHNMQGYTSAGCGTSIVNVRLNCPPEITLHTLKSTNESSNQ